MKAKKIKKTKKVAVVEEPEVIGDENDLIDPEQAPVESDEPREPVQLDQPIAAFKREEPLPTNNNFNQVNMPSNKLPEWLRKNKTIVIAVIIGVIIGGVVLWKVLGSKKVGSVSGLLSNNPASSGETGPQAPLNTDKVSFLTGLPCDNFNRRAIAVMEAADVSVRPLSGTSEADLVIEMPAITASITRLMAFYVCNSPKEIGSIRSTRHDYITLAKGMDAMLAHWGGSHFALDMLKNKNTVPDLDAMNNPGSAFFRKDGIPAPDNGFASYDGLSKAAQQLGFRMTNNFEGYPHQAESDPGSRPKGGSLRVGFAGVYGVNYAYDPSTNTYLRTWGGKEDTDRANGQRIAPKNVVVMFAASRQIEGQYNDVDVEGEGEMHAYMDGQEVTGKWVKEKKNCVINNDMVCMTDSKLKFLKADGTELKFVPGQIWIEILEPGQTLKWTPAQ
jgi:hypothetical protein